MKQINIEDARKCTVAKKESYDDLQSELGSLNGVAAGSKKLLEKLNKLGDHCPTCEQEVDSDFKQALILEESKKVAEAREKQDEIEEEYRKLNETIESTTVLEKLKGIGKTCIEVSTELSQWPSWIRTSSKSAWLEYEMTWAEQKAKWSVSQKKMNSEQNTTPESK